MLNVSCLTVRNVDLLNRCEVIDMSDMKTVYLLDLGTLLTDSDPEIDSYNMVYDKKYGYYDIGQDYYATLADAVADAVDHVKANRPNNYAVISETSIPADADIDDTYVEGETYDVADIVYSIACIDGQLVPQFVDGQTVQKSA